jgi:membrane glycosyltransferase
MGLLTTPEEAEPPQVLQRAHALLPSWQQATGGPQGAFERLAADRRLLALHLAMLTHHSDWDAIDAESLDRARQALAGGTEPAVLSRDDTVALLFDQPLLEAMAAGGDPAGAALTLRQAESALPAAA